MKRPLKKATMDGNTAAAHASYAFTEVATISLYVEIFLEHIQKLLAN